MSNDFIKEMNNFGWEVSVNGEKITFKKDGKIKEYHLYELRKIMFISVKNHIEL